MQSCWKHGTGVLRVQLKLLAALVVKGSSIKTRWLEVGYYSVLWFRTAKKQQR